MKRIVSSILLAGLCISLLPMSAAAAAVESDNLAIGAEVIYLSDGDNDPHVSRENNWYVENINDGDRIETNKMDDGRGEGAGYHSHIYDGDDPEHVQWIGFNFGSPKTFNTLIATPTPGSTFPVDFQIQVSVDGRDWTAVLARTDYTVSENAPAFCPQTFTFDTQTAQYIRLYVTKLGKDANGNCNMKLTEIEIYNRDQPLTIPVNLAVNKPITVDGQFSNLASGGNWDCTLLNDGDRVNLDVTSDFYGQFGGYHSPFDGVDFSSGTATAQFTVELGDNTVFNQVVIYPSHEYYAKSNIVDANSDEYGDNTWIFFPENFKIQVSDDGESWTDAHEEIGYQCDGIGPQVFSFDEVSGKYVRFQMMNMTYNVKLTEFEVYRIVTNVDDDQNQGQDEETEDNSDGNGTVPDNENIPTAPATGTALFFPALFSVISVTGIFVLRRKRFIC